MANPTTNYGFVLPTSSDLVTDLPADFDVALQGVDTRLKALQPGTTLGDLAYSSATANTNTRLPIGTNGQVLAVSGGVPAWTTTADVTPLTTKGDLFTFTTVDARLGIGANNTVLTADSAEATGMKWAAPAAAPITNATATVATRESTTSGSFTDLTTAGPAVTLTTGTKVLVIVSGAIDTNAAVDSNGVMDFAISGATTRAATQTTSIRSGSTSMSSSKPLRFSSATIQTVTAGSNTFTAKYQSPSTNALFFANREILVIDLGS